MSNLILKYKDSLGTVHSQSVVYLSLKGFDEPEKARYAPDIIWEKMDGSRETAYVGFQKNIIADLGVIQSYSVHQFILAFLGAQTKSIYYPSAIGVNEIFVAPNNSEYEDEWVNNCKLGKKFVLDVYEAIVLTQWVDYPAPIPDTDLYIKTHVKVTGTQASPEEFITNDPLGKLENDSTGQNYPAISLLSYVVTVFCNGTPYQSRKVNQVGLVEQSGSNIKFYLALDDAGSDSSDGYSYFDIVIALEAIPV